MHELSITQSVVEICEQNAGGRRVLSVTLEVGGLSGIVPDAVEFCFEACTRGTLLEGAKLIIERVEPKGRHTAAHGEDYQVAEDRRRDQVAHG